MVSRRTRSSLSSFTSEGRAEEEGEEEEGEEEEGEEEEGEEEEGEEEEGEEDGPTPAALAVLNHVRRVLFR